MNRSGKCEGPGGGGSTGCIMHRVHTSNYVVDKYQMPLWMSEWKKLDFYEMVKPKNKIGLF